MLYFELVIILAVVMEGGREATELKINDKDMTLHKIRRLMRMTQIIHMDTEVKLKHILKYIDMQIGTLDYELGLITGLMIERFKLMLKLYRESSDVYYYQYSRMNWMSDSGYIYGQRLLVLSSCFLSIITLKGEFTDAVDRYIGMKSRMRELTKQCKKDKICHRRSNNALEDLGPEDLESDYFGHTVPKVRKVTNSVTDRVDQLLELEEKSLGTPYEKLPKLSVHQDKFTKLNDWLRYLANGGMARNKLRVNKIDHNDDDFYELTRSESFSSTPMKKSRTKRMRFTPYTGPTFETDDGSMGIDRDMEQMKISKKPKVPWGVRGSDYEFKKKARDAYRERQRAGFDPKREGIDIELPYEY